MFSRFISHQRHHDNSVFDFLVIFCVIHLFHLSRAFGQACPKHEIFISIIKDGLEKMSVILALQSGLIIKLSKMMTRILSVRHRCSLFYYLH